MEQSLNAELPSNSTVKIETLLLLWQLLHPFPPPGETYNDAEVFQKICTMLEQTQNTTPFTLQETTTV